MWTLVRHNKDGQEVPIKVSVFDIFRPGPSRPSKPSEQSRPARPRANTKAAVAPKKQENAAKNKTSSASEPEVWTEEDDTKLRDLKTGGNMSWKQILAELGDKHTSEGMKARWKEIEGKPVSGTAIEGGSAKSKKDEEKKARAEKAKAEGLARQAAVKEGKGGKKKGILKVASPMVPGGFYDLLTSDVQNSNAKPAPSQETELKYSAAKYDKDKWLAVASRHFDRTGQRISPEMAKAMCGATD